MTGSGGLNFRKTKYINVERKGLEVFIQTDKPVYKPGEKGLCGLLPKIVLNDGIIVRCKWEHWPH